MTDAQQIEREFKAKVCDQVALLPEGVGRFRVLTPFRFDDGDHLSIVLKQNGRGWYLSDEAHTYMHLSYDVPDRDRQRGNRQEIADNALCAFSIEDRDGELILRVPGEDYGNSLYSFVQGLLKISDLTFLSRERVRSTFLEDFRAFVANEIPADRWTFDWHDEESDPHGDYAVDCRINHMPRPLFIYALTGDEKVAYATISIMHHERNRLPFRSLAIFEDQRSISRGALARLTDVVGKQFSNLTSNRERIGAYIRDAIAN
jgi:hypothetical protein